MMKTVVDSEKKSDTLVSKQWRERDVNLIEPWRYSQIPSPGYQILSSAFTAWIRSIFGVYFRSGEQAQPRINLAELKISPDPCIWSGMTVLGLNLEAKCTDCTIRDTIRGQKLREPKQLLSCIIVPRVVVSGVGSRPDPLWFTPS